MVGPLVTNPASRDPTVTASVFATLNDMFGNRTVCAIGRGDSALRVLGRKPTTLAQTERAIHEIRELAEGRAIAGAERRRGRASRGSATGASRSGWPPTARRPWRSSGRCADGFVLQVADPEILRWTLAHVRGAAEAAGRDPDEITVLVCAPAYVGDDIAHARDQCRWFGGHGRQPRRRDRRALRQRTARCPPRSPTTSRRARATTTRTTAAPGNPDTEFVPDEIVDRFCILGEPAAHVAKLRELRDAGMDQFAIYLMHDAPERTLDAYGAEVIPAFADA